MATLIASKNAGLESWKRSALQDAIDAAAAAAARVPGCPPALVPVTVAQFLLESNWGNAAMGDAHNSFGIKARPGEACVTRATTEYVRGRPGQVAAAFRTDPAYGDKLVAIMRSRGLLETFGFAPA